MGTQDTRNRTGRRTAGIAGAALVAALAGCGGDDGGGSTSAAGAKDALVVMTPAPKGPVDRITWALPYGEPTSLDPAYAGDYSPSTVVANLCEGLMRNEPDFTLKPSLAERVEQPDAKTIVFHLRKDVRFWDGRPMTADDVTASLARNVDPKLNSINLPVFERVRDIRKTGAHEVTVRFRKPDARFLPTMAGTAGAVGEASVMAQQGKRYGTPRGGLMCTGPYRLASWRSGESIAITRNPNYWNAALKPQVGTVTFRFIADSSTLTSALLSGDVDGTYEAPVGSTKALKGADVGTLYSGPSTQSVSFGPMRATGAGADPRVRRALDLAIDKRAFVKNVLQGAGEPLKTLTPPFVFSGSPAKDVYQAGYDALEDNATPNLEEAKRLIAEAKPSKAPLYIAVGAGQQLPLQTATIIQAAGKQLGLDIRIKQLQDTEISALFYDPAKRQGLDFIATTGYVEGPSPLYYAPLFAVKAGQFNWSGFHDAQVEKDIETALDATDPQKAAKAFVAAQARFAPARLQVSIATAHERLFLNKRITGAPASFSYITTPWAAYLGAAR
jgi:peptide/nickel transport system substrate-binding protein